MDSISSDMDEVCSVNSSADVFVIGDFNVYDKDWLTHSGRTYRPGELIFCYNFSFLNELIQMINVLLIFPTVAFKVLLFWI